MNPVLTKGVSKVIGLTYKPEVKRATFAFMDKSRRTSYGQTLTQIHRGVSNTTPAKKSIVLDCISDLMKEGLVVKSTDGSMRILYRLLPPEERKVSRSKQGHYFRV